MLKKLKLTGSMKTYNNFRSNTKKICPFHHRGLQCKCRKSRDAWDTGRFGLRVQNEAKQRLAVLSGEHTGHSKHTLPSTQETTLHVDMTRWSILKSDWLYLAAKDGEALCSQQNIRPRAECGWDHELLIEKFRFKLNKGGKTTRPYRYDLNQILYDYIVEMMSRFKGLDLVDKVPEELQCYEDL